DRGDGDQIGQDHWLGEAPDQKPQDVPRACPHALANTNLPGFRLRFPGGETVKSDGSGYQNEKREARKQPDLATWAQKQGIKLLHIQPGKPQQNDYVERYNRTVRYDWLSQYLFD